MHSWNCLVLVKLYPQIIWMFEYISHSVTPLKVMCGINPSALMSVLRCEFSSSEQTQDWLRRLTTVLRPSTRLDEIFAFAFHTCSASVPAERDLHDEICHPGTGYKTPQLSHTHGCIITEIFRTLD